MTRRRTRLTPLVLAVCLAPTIAAAQARGGGPAAPAVVSPEVGSDRRITVRLYAPKAEAVRLDRATHRAYRWAPERR
jgi:hypothetical protein